MASGDHINYANYVAMHGTSWLHGGNLGFGRNTSVTYYIAAAAFSAYLSIKGSSLWGYQEGAMNVYRWNGSSFVHVYGSTQSVRGSRNSYSWRFDHNYQGGSSGDVHDCHLWKVSYYVGNNDGSSPDSWLYTGGIGCLPESIYNSYFKGRHIIGSRGDYWRTGTYSSDSAFINAQGYSALRGTLISVSSGTNVFVCAKDE